MSDQNDKLLPCPFCAAQATLLTHGVACDSCLCAVERLKGDSDEDLVAAWNSRATPAPQAAPRDVQAAIMNIPCKVDWNLLLPEERAYRRGHRDARHAAAELVAAAPAVAITQAATSEPVSIWPLIDAYADAREEYQRSTARHLATTQRENFAHAKAELIFALAGTTPNTEAPSDARMLLESHDPQNPQAGHCHKCGLPMIQNPHPDAGKPGAYLEVGCPTECLPCMVASRHAWAKRATKAEFQLRAALSAQQAGVQEPCDECKGTGQVAYESSGLAEDGNAPVAEPCPMCAYGQAGVQAAPSDSELLELATGYDDVIRRICFEHAAGGYNSDGFMVPATADAKLRWIIAEERRAALAAATQTEKP